MKNLVINPKDPMCTLTMNRKTNLYVLILLLFLTQLMVGCGGTRKGFFVEIGFGGAVVSSNEKSLRREIGVWARPDKPGEFEKLLHVIALSEPQTSIQKELDRYYEDADVFGVSTPINGKIGYGLSDRLLISFRSVGYRLNVIGIGVTYFTKKTAPSLFFDIVLPISSTYKFYEISDELLGKGGSISVGYEWRKHLTAQLNLSFGTYRDDNPFYLYSEKSHRDVLGLLRTYTITYPIEAMSFSLGLTINYLWY